MRLIISSTSHVQVVGGSTAYLPKLSSDKMPSVPLGFIEGTSNTDIGVHRLPSNCCIEHLLWVDLVSSSLGWRSLVVLFSNEMTSIRIILTTILFMSTCTIQWESFPLTGEPFQT